MVYYITRFYDNRVIQGLKKKKKCHAGWPAWHKVEANSIIQGSSSSQNSTFAIIELQKMGISLISLRKRVKHWFFCTKRAFVHFGHKYFNVKLAYD